MTKVVSTRIAGFTPDTLPAYHSPATFRSEPDGRGCLERVVTTFTDIAEPSRRVTVPMTPEEARNYAAWLIAEADHVDYLNAGYVENHTPRVVHPEN